MVLRARRVSPSNGWVVKVSPEDWVPMISPVPLSCIVAMSLSAVVSLVRMSEASEVPRLERARIPTKQTRKAMSYVYPVELSE